MKPGRELDALVAEKVMGWKPEIERSVHIIGDGRFGVEQERTINLPPNYSTSIASAWEVVERMVGDEMEFDLDLHYEPEYTIVEFKKVIDGKLIAESGEVWRNPPPFAICLAALKAVNAL